MNRLALFSEARARSEQVKLQNPSSRALSSIIDQLSYLINVEDGKVDGSRVKDINIGVLAAREIEDIDLGLANQLHEVSAVVRSIEK